MSGIIEQIQRDALDPNFPVSALLRKVKLAAAKLKLPKVEDWVDSEPKIFRMIWLQMRFWWRHRLCVQNICSRNLKSVATNKSVPIWSVLPLSHLSADALTEPCDLPRYSFTIE